MQPWLVRGLVMAVVYAVVETLLAAVQVNHPDTSSVLEPVLLALLVGVSGAWAGVDGWLRRPRRGMNWFYAGLIGGVLAGVLSVIGRASFVDQTGVWALSSALTGDAAFIALLIMLPAGLGVFVGGRLQPPPRVARDPDEDDRRRPARPVRAQGRRPVRSTPRG
jgi:hypothetical protein